MFLCQLTQRIRTHITPGSRTEVVAISALGRMRGTGLSTRTIQPKGQSVMRHARAGPIPGDLPARCPIPQPVQSCRRTYRQLSAVMGSWVAGQADPPHPEGRAPTPCQARAGGPPEGGPSQTLHLFRLRHEARNRPFESVLQSLLFPRASLVPLERQGVLRRHCPRNTATKGE
jgi:hypothetical protein